jgi:hypothetical protein
MNKANLGDVAKQLVEIIDKAASKFLIENAKLKTALTRIYFYKKQTDGEDDSQSIISMQAIAEGALFEKTISLNEVGNGKG